MAEAVKKGGWMYNHLRRCRPLVSDCGEESMPDRPRACFPYVLVVSLLLAGGLAVRIGLAWSAVAVTRDAADHYLPLAQAWQEGAGGKAFAGGIPPLYPMLTGCLARLIGDVETAGRAVSIAGGMLVLVFVFLLTYRLAGRWSALVGLALVAFHPYLCQHSADVGPDSLAAGLLAGTVYAVCAYLVTFSFAYALLTAVLLAGLALTRPEGFAYAPLALGVLVFWPVQRTADTEARGRGDKGWAAWSLRQAQGRLCVVAGPWASRTCGRVLCRRMVHIGLLLVLLAGLCAPRLLSVHARTGVWALDTRQRTWTARLWRALRSGEPEYGQLRIWSRGGLEAVGGTIGAAAASFGPAGLIFGGYALLARRRLRRRRVAMVVLVFVLYGVAVVLVGNRVSKRYLLGPAAVWQVWTAIGVVLLFVRVRARLLQRGASPARLRYMPAAAGLVIAALQLPWVPEQLHREFLADRRMGEWIAANLPAGTRIAAREPVPIWYGRATRVEFPLFKPSWMTPTYMALRAKEMGVRAILVGRTVNPAISGQLAQDTGVKLVFIYSGSLGEAGSGVETYLDYMRYNVQAIVDALK